MAGNINFTQKSMHLDLKELDSPPSLFAENPLWRKFFLFVIFALAALIRRDEIRAPGHLIEREYNSAIFARSFYFDGNDKIEAWRRANAIATRDRYPVLEPPLTEYAVSLIYRIMGREEIWYSRYLTNFFWLVGGIFLYRLVRVLISADAAMVAVGYYLFTPWGIIISRSFQPDSLMMMMFMISLYGIVLYFEEPSWGKLLSAAFLSGITLLLRPLVLFSIFGAFIALSIYKNGKWTQIFSKRSAVFTFLCLIFPLTFYGYGIHVVGSLQGQAELSFRPHLLTKWAFWTGWFENAAYVIGGSFLLFTILGYFLLRSKQTQFFVIGLAAGYFVFGLFFTFHIHTHPYYHIQVFPLVAICISPILLSIANLIKESAGRYWWTPLSAVLVLAVYFSWRDVRGTLYSAVFEDPKLAWEIGKTVKHSPRTVFVSYHYGMPLEYYGEFSGAAWPVSIDDPFYRIPDAREQSVQERIDQLGFKPEYFVITYFDLYQRKHQDLETYLESACSARLETTDYLIYSHCQILSEH